MSSVERVVEQSLLYDYYGELLTKHQRRIYEAAVFENLSLGEIAEESGISRQGVHDLIRRCDLKLAQYEETLHLLEKHEQAMALGESIEKMSLKLKSLYAAGKPDRPDSQTGDCRETDRIVSPEEETLDELLKLVRQLLEEI